MIDRKLILFIFCIISFIYEEILKFFNLFFLFYYLPYPKFNVFNNLVLFFSCLSMIIIIINIKLLYLIIIKFYYFNVIILFYKIDF